MRNNRFRLILFILPFLILASCSIQKRVHRKGYHVAWNHHTKTHADQVVKTTEEAVTKITDENLTASNSIERSIILPKKKSVLTGDTCSDKLKLRSGEELSIKLVEIGEELIKYRRCDNLYGPTLAIEKKRVERIIYYNGGDENLVVLNEEGIQVANNEGVYTHVPKKENKLGNLSMVLHAVLYGLSLIALFLFLVAPAVDWLIFAYAGIFLLSFILPTIVAFISLFQFKNEPGKYSGIWMPIYIIANKFWLFVVLAVVSFGMNGTLLQQLIFVPLLLAYIGLFIFALLPKKKKLNAK